MGKYGWFFTFKSGRKLELWLYGMTFCRTDNETQIRLSSCLKYKGKNLKLVFLFFFLLDNMPVKQKKTHLLFIHAQRHCCEDLITGTTPHDCSHDECTLRTKKTNGHDGVGKNILPKELKREVNTPNILLLRIGVMNLSKTCFYFSRFWFGDLKFFRLEDVTTYFTKSHDYCHI